MKTGIKEEITYSTYKLSAKLIVSNNLEQYFFQGVWKNQYLKKIKDPAKFPDEDGLVPGYREILFHMESSWKQTTSICMGEWWFMTEMPFHFHPSSDSR